MRALIAVVLPLTACLIGGLAGWFCLPVVVARNVADEYNRSKFEDLTRYYQPAFAVVGATAGLWLGAFVASVWLEMDRDQGGT
ncbi:MAG: hypothetical protein K8U57_08600 [Planctomycetes bacterium]|nr:hypothetical protein [Planctomycetota bacterium]